MEIRNIYEDSYGDERLYSVLMDEDEVSLFSELQKEFGLVKAANRAAKKAWERSMAAPNVGVKKYLPSANGRTVLNPEYGGALKTEVGNFRRSQQPKASHEIFTSGQSLRPSSRGAIKKNLEFPSRYEDLSVLASRDNVRGVGKSTIRQRAMEDISRGAKLGNVEMGLR